MTETEIQSMMIDNKTINQRIENSLRNIRCRSSQAPVYIKTICVCTYKEAEKIGIHLLYRLRK